MTPEQNAAYISAANDIRAAKGKPKLTPKQENEVLAKLAAKQAAKGPKTTGLGAPTPPPFNLASFLGLNDGLTLLSYGIIAAGAVGAYYLYKATKPKHNPVDKPAPASVPSAP